MGSKAKFVTRTHVRNGDFIRNSIDHVAWVRRRKIELPREIFDAEIHNRPDSLVDIAMSLGGVEAPGFPPMMGIGVRFLDVPETKTVTGDIYYVTAYEVGSKLSHENMALDNYDENEQISAPPEWLEMPFDEEIDNGEVAEDTGSSGEPNTGQSVPEGD